MRRAGLRVAATLAGKGTVRDQQGELVVQRQPLKMTGRLILSDAGTAPARCITVIDHAGTVPPPKAPPRLDDGQDHGEDRHDGLRHLHRDHPHAAGSRNAFGWWP
ncbi:hypothetical protein [Streptomyces sp. NPDC021562]|uniref:hypothetical protein n=1 Tax=Streptomyces sp. NPDC021562 TaxID=3155121 RepID=UPI0033F2CEFA